MYRVVVYEDDRQTVAGTIEFNKFEDAEHYAKLNQPCYIYVSWSKVAEFGFEEEE